MARKSRKETAAVAVQEADATCRAAIYVRLSVEDTHTHSVSIETQQMIIARYLEQYPEISVYDTYIDNGATGTNFHRPGFQQMLSDIEAGHVNCVIVKDLSRLGRNTIDTGYYIEQYFRIRSIRFIAVNENFDTANPEDAHSGIIIPLRNMINEAYALDIGRKIKAQQRQAMKDGKFIGARTPYGYLKAEDDCHQLIIDPVAAVVVQRMFRWASEGAGLNTIAVRLNEAGVLTPSHYKKMQGKITHENLLGSGKWQTRTVGVILRSEVYTGDLVQGQTKTVDHRQVKADAEEWTVVRDTHEAIISREQFAAVQEILNQTASRTKAREVKAYTPNLLKGKVFCAHCGGSLHRQRNIRKKSNDVYFYHCLSQSRISKDACPGVTIREDALLDTLADMLQEALNTALGDYRLSLAELPRQAADRAELREKITSRKQEIQRLRGIVRSLYENLVQGVLTKDEYFDYKEKYESRIADLAVEMEQLEDGLQTMDTQIEQHRALEQDAAQIKTDRALTGALIERLIDRIEVSHDKQITVRYRFQSEFETYAGGAGTMQKYVIALYIRLSIEDYKYDSLSIENQSLVLHEYAASMPEALNAEIMEFIDNGYSGTNFERPQVQKLIELVRANQIDCIIVKDFSRFGRNSIETGYFIERVFPLFHTRFISISDDFDSSKFKGDTGGMDVAFKYLISEYYSRDMSIKTKSAKYAKMQRGEYQSKICPYGYRKSADGRMEPDPEAAAIVQLIFQLAAEGVNATAITRELFRRNIPTPGQYKAARGNHTHDISRCHGIWSASTILRILEDERYTGVYVIGKRAVLEVGGNRSRLKDRESWYIIPDHHPAIVEKSAFDTVQASQLRFSPPNKKKRDYPLKGKAFCGCCGHVLSRTIQKTSYYYCRHSEADEESRCHKMRLNAAELEQTVFLTLKKQMEAAAPLAPGGTLRVDAFVPKRAEYEQQIEALQDGKHTLYERYLMGEIDLNTYKAEKAACDELLLKTKNAYAAVLAQAKQKQDEQARQDNCKEAFKAIFDADTLTTELAALLTDRVLAYPDECIEIAYKIRDIFE